MDFKGRNLSYKSTIRIPAVLALELLLCVGAQSSFGQSADGRPLVWGPFYLPSSPASATNVVAMAAGDAHCVALRADGTIVTWGINSPGNLTNIVAVGAGSTHGMALRDDGTVQLWGNILGSNITNAPADATNIMAVSVGPGAQHAAVVRTDGSVAEWAGPGRASIVANIPSAAANVVSVAAGAFHTVALRSDGKLVAWGENGSGQLNIPSSATNIVAVASGWYHSMALRANGTLVAWGSLGLPPTFNGSNFVDIACGGNHVLALKRDGTVVAYGDNNQGQSTVPAYATNLAAIAGGSYNSLAIPAYGRPVFSGKPVPRTVASGATAFLRLTAVGQLPLAYRWSFSGTNIPSGTNSFLSVTNAQPSQSGLYTLTVSNALGSVTNENILLSVLPVIITTQPRTQAAYTGATITFTVRADGRGPLAYQWQFNGTDISGATNQSLTLTNVQASDVGAYTVIVSNEFGSATSSPAFLTVTPILITGQPQAQNAFRGATVSLSVSAQSSQPLSYQWLFEGTAILGATSNVFTLTSVDFSQQGNYAAILSNSLATVTSAPAPLSVISVATWGYNTSNPTNSPAYLTNILAVSGNLSLQLALSTNHSIYSWNTTGDGLPVPALSNIVAISAGWSHGLALDSDGQVVAWGQNGDGQANVPAGLSNAVAVSTGGAHSVALKSDGTVAVWGANNSGQTNMPPGVTNIVAIDGGDSFTLALRADGTVAAWGNNFFGQCNVPVDLSNVVAISAGGYFGMALTGEGKVVPWGSNSDGQTNVPPSATNVLAISAGRAHAMALRADGTVVAWGYNFDGETNVPVTLTNVIAISAGYNRSCALIGDGPVVTRAAAASPSWSGNGFMFILPTQSGRTYGLEYREAADAPGWTSFPLVAGTGGNMIFRDESATNATQRFYRVRRW